MDDCIVNPTNCPDGFSMSIWEKVNYGDKVLNIKATHDKFFVYSTGKLPSADLSFCYYHPLLLFVGVFHLSTTWYLICCSTEIGSFDHGQIAIYVATSGICPDFVRYSHDLITVLDILFTMTKIWQFEVTTIIHCFYSP